MLLPGSDTFFLEVTARVSLKVATQGYFKGKKLWRFRFLGCFTKAKPKEYWSSSEKFGITNFFSATCFPQVGVHVSLKVATKGCKKNPKILDFTIFSVKQKRSSVTKKLKFLGLIWNAWFRHIFSRIECTHFTESRNQILYSIIVRS